MAHPISPKLTPNSQMRIKDNPNSFRSISLKNLPGRKTLTSPTSSQSKKIARKRPSSEDSEDDLYQTLDNKEFNSIHERIIATRQNFLTLKNEIQQIIQNNPDNNSEFYSILASLQGIFKLIELEIITKIGEDPSRMTKEKLDSATPNLLVYSKIFKTVDKVLHTVLNESNTPNGNDEKRDTEKIPEIMSSLSPTQKQLAKIISEEEQYLAKLDTIVNKFLGPIQRDQVISKHDEQTLFSTSQEIFKLHNTIYKFLKKAVESPNIEFSDFLNSKIPEFKVYQQYSINFTDATKCFERLMKEKSFSSVIKQLEAKEGSLLQLLQRPLSRIEELIFQLEVYIKILSPSSSERSKLVDVKEKLEDVVISIEQRESVADNLAKVMEIGLAIDGLDENLVRPDRRYVHSGPIKLHLVGQKKSICDYGFLFNDVFIYCTSNGKNYSYVGQLFMHSLTFNASEDSSQFQILSGKESFTCTCNNDKEKLEWLVNIGKVIREVERTRKVFGVPLNVLMKRETDSDIPVIVEKSIHFIYEYGLDKEGLFRQTGRSTQIDKLKGQLNQGAKVFFSENMDVHSVAALFKLWLRELPEPLLTWKSFPEFIVASQLSPNFRLQKIKKIIEGLPRENRYVCQHMMKCLKAVCDNESKTKMNPSNLAVVFAPNIIKNADVDFNQSHFECANESFKLMIENYNEIFKDIEIERSNTQLRPEAQKKKSRENNNNHNWGSNSLNFDEPFKEGNLQFTDKDKKKWTSRYVVLRAEGIQILREVKSKKPKLTIPVSGVQISVATNVGKQFCFNIESSKKELFYFSAANQNELDEWMNAIKECVKLTESIKQKQNNF